MSLRWPGLLAALLVVPLLVGLYVRLQRRRAAQTAALAASGLVSTGPAVRLGRNRHLPFLLYLAAVAILLFALARPQTSVAVPRRTGTVILAFDVSNSMTADDLEPTRLDAAKLAARSFVEDQPSSIEIGVVAFGDGALVTQTPTTERAEVLAAIERLAPLGGTAVGLGIFTALDAIVDEPIDLTTEDLDGDLDEVAMGYHGSATIVVLSDGENTQGPDPLEIAQLAANAGVHIATIGVGGTDGAIIEIDGFQVATALDEELLSGIAETTGGTYHRAEDAAALRDVYSSIDLRITVDGKQREITGLLAGVGVGLLLSGGALAMRWFGRIV
jgi:Ca-activated chloride channel homolog